MTALIMAAIKDNAEMVQLLLDKGANMEAADKVTPAFHQIGHGC